MDAEYVIVGNSAGGIAAAEAIRRRDRDGSIVIISDEPYPAYSRPMIAHYLAGTADEAAMHLRPPSFYADNRITPLLGRAAVAIDAAQRSLELADGERIGWRRLLLATGAQPIVPPIRGGDRPAVHTFTTLDDAKAVAAELSAVRSAAVIGGGLIGAVAAEALAKHPIAVTIVEMLPRLLPTILDDEAGEIAAAALNAAGVGLLTGRRVVEVLGRAGDGRVRGVTLDDGRSLDCELLIVAAGVAPRLDLAQAAGIRVNRGIVVDRQMQTSISDVFACGDGAEVYDFVHGDSRVIPTWPNAVEGGAVAGDNMAGGAATYRGTTTLSSMHYFDLPIAAAGMTLGDAADGCEVLTSRGDGVYRRAVLRDDRLVGMVLVRDIWRAGPLLALMRDCIDVSAFKTSLVADTFGMASLPQWRWSSQREAVAP